MGNVDQTKAKRKSVLSAKQRRDAADLRSLGLTPGEARYQVLTPEQKREHLRQVRDSERRRYEKNPRREIIKQARHSAASARRRGAKRGAHEFTITEDQVPWPRHCPVLPWIKLHYPGHYRHDPAGASLDRIDGKKGYVPGNVNVVSLRANLLRKDITNQELRALADFFLFPHDPDEV